MLYTRAAGLKIDLWTSSPDHSSPSSSKAIILWFLVFTTHFNTRRPLCQRQNVWGLLDPPPAGSGSAGGPTEGHSGGKKQVEEREAEKRKSKVKKGGFEPDCIEPPLQIEGVVPSPFVTGSNQIPFGAIWNKSCCVIHDMLAFSGPTSSF